MLTLCVSVLCVYRGVFSPGAPVTPPLSKTNIQVSLLGYHNIYDLSIGSSIFANKCLHISSEFVFVNQFLPTKFIFRLCMAVKKVYIYEKTAAASQTTCLAT